MRGPLRQAMARRGAAGPRRRTPEALNGEGGIAAKQGAQVAIPFKGATCAR